MKIRLLILLSIFVCFLACIRKENSIKIKGSDTEVNVVVRLAEEYHKSSPDVYLSVSGGGSGIGITSLLNGQADIANSSRRINEYESRLFIERQIDIDTLVFAEDAVAFVVSSDLPIDTILSDDLGRILSGVHINWRRLFPGSMPVSFMLKSLRQFFMAHD